MSILKLRLFARASFTGRSPPDRRSAPEPHSLRLPNSLPSRGVNGIRPLLESPVELAGLSLRPIPANGLGLAPPVSPGLEAGIIDINVPRDDDLGGG